MVMTGNWRPTSSFSFGVGPNIGFTSAHLQVGGNPAPSSIFRVDIRPVRSVDTFHGPFLRSQHHNMIISFAKGWCDLQEPFTLKHPLIIPKKVCKRIPSKLSTYRKFGPGMILLRKHVSRSDQADIVKMCDKWGMSPGGFYKPPDTVNMLNSRFMCFGRSWDPKSLPVPNQLVSLAATAIEDAKAHLDELPSMCPDTCLVSYFPYKHVQVRNIDLRQDRDESGRRFPVVSIFIGDTPKLGYCLCGDKNKLKIVPLQSGDILIYGGKSRHIYHAVMKTRSVMPSSVFRESGLRSGYLNLTLTQF